MLSSQRVIIFLLLCICSATCYGKGQGPINANGQQVVKGKEDTATIHRLLENAYYYIHKQDAEITDIDSAVNTANQAMKMSSLLGEQRWQAKCYLAYAAISNERGDQSLARKYVQKAILQSKYLTPADLGDLYAASVEYYNHDVDSEYTGMVNAIKLSMRYYDKAGMREQYAYQLVNLGIAYTLKGHVRQAIDTMQKAIAIYQQIHYPEIRYAYNLLGNEYNKAGDYKQALKYCLLAMQETVAAKDSSKAAWDIYLYLGHVYFNLKQYDEALKYMQAAQSLMFRGAPSTVEILTVSRDIINLYYHTNQVDKVAPLLAFLKEKYPPRDLASQLTFDDIAIMYYMKIKRLDLAKEYAIKLRDFSRTRPPADFIQFYVYDYLVKYYMAARQYSKVYEYCIGNDSLCKRFGLLEEASYNYSGWYKADSALGNYAAALVHYQLAKKLDDSLLNRDKVNEIERLQVAYQTQKKEQDIKLLTQQAQLQDSKLHQTRLTKNIFLAGAGMLSLLLGLGYNRYRLKQRSNDLLERKQSEIGSKNAALNTLLKEKEWLIKEMHHRVKNNLQIVISLLNSQSMYLDNKAALDAIQESQHRMYAMSLIHQKLYQSENNSMVYMPLYIRELTDYLYEGSKANNLRFEQQADEISLDISQAIPVGLILNEAVTNAIKYAFPDGRQGVIAISLKRNGDNIKLLIADDGIGFCEETVHQNSLGLNLIRGLSNQLGGNYTIKGENGAAIEVEFPYAGSMSM